jgi:hypothetical protein
MAQQPRTPDLEAQRAAMRKLEFLVGRWAGEARLQRGPGEPILMAQTEDVQFKLDGLLLLTEGIGRGMVDGKAILNALAIVSYDDETGTYRMRAFNDGRFLETELKLLDDGRGMTWGFTLGQIKTSSVMRMTEEGDWTELHEIAIGSQPLREFMEVRVSRKR